MEHASGGAIGDEGGEQAGEALHGLVVAQAYVVEQGVVQADLGAVEVDRGRDEPVEALQVGAGAVQDGLGG